MISCKRLINIDMNEIAHIHVHCQISLMCSADILWQVQYCWYSVGCHIAFIILANIHWYLGIRNIVVSIDIKITVFRWNIIIPQGCFPGALYFSVTVRTVLYLFISSWNQAILELKSLLGAMQKNTSADSSCICIFVASLHNRNFCLQICHNYNTTQPF